MSRKNGASSHKKLAAALHLLLVKTKPGSYSIQRLRQGQSPLILGTQNFSSSSPGDNLDVYEDLSSTFFFQLDLHEF